jgi:putative effector of murein hydrolase LrgA (UPF0299 family)
LTLPIETGMNRAKSQLPLFMLPIGLFVVAMTSVLTSVWWACNADRDET